MGAFAAMKISFMILGAFLVVAASQYEEASDSSLYEQLMELYEDSLRETTDYTYSEEEENDGVDMIVPENNQEMVQHGVSYASGPNPKPLVQGLVLLKKIQPRAMTSFERA